MSAAAAPHWTQSAPRAGGAESSESVLWRWRHRRGSYQGSPAVPGPCRDVPVCVASLSSLPLASRLLFELEIALRQLWARFGPGRGEGAGLVVAALWEKLRTNEGEGGHGCDCPLPASHHSGTEDTKEQES